MTCNHCPGELQPHDGMQHCEACGCYLVNGELDPNHSACNEAQRREIPVAVQPPRSAVSFVNPGVTPIADEVVKGKPKPAAEGAVIAPEDSATPERITRRSRP